MHVQEFNSLEEMLAEIARQREAADAHVGDRGRLFRPGQRFVRLAPEFGTIIYGEILDPIEAEREAGADEDELEFQRQLRDAPHMVNFRFCRCWSEICPEGEFGDVHVSSMHLDITAAEFDRARDAGWPSDPAGLVERVLQMKLSRGGSA